MVSSVARRKRLRVFGVGSERDQCCQQKCAVAKVWDNEIDIDHVFRLVVIGVVDEAHDK